MKKEEAKAVSTRKKAKVFSINVSNIKGISKTPVLSVNLIENFGLEADAHSGPGIRQVSLLAIESIRKQKECAKIKNGKRIPVLA